MSSGTLRDYTVVHFMTDLCNFGSDFEQCLKAMGQKIKYHLNTGPEFKWSDLCETHKIRFLSANQMNQGFGCLVNRSNTLRFQFAMLYYLLKVEMFLFLLKFQLGNGTAGTDVRVRNNKLHCQNCYSNDEGKILKE